MSYADLSRVEYLPFTESAELIKNRQIDGTLQSGGLGVAFVRDLASTHAIRIVEIPVEIASKMGAPFAPAVIPAGTYSGQDSDVATVIIPNFLLTHDKVSDDLAYGMAKALFANLPRMIAAHSSAEHISLETATRDLPVPLHPGAAAFYRDQGVL